MKQSEILELMDEDARNQFLAIQSEGQKETRQKAVESGLKFWSGEGEIGKRRLAREERLTKSGMVFLNWAICKSCDIGGFVKGSEGAVAFLKAHRDHAESGVVRVKFNRDPRTAKEAKEAIAEHGLVG